MVMVSKHTVVMYAGRWHAGLVCVCVCVCVHVCTFWQTVEMAAHQEILRSECRMTLRTRKANCASNRSKQTLSCS